MLWAGSVTNTAWKRSFWKAATESLYEHQHISNISPYSTRCSKVTVNSISRQFLWNQVFKSTSLNHNFKSVAHIFTCTNVINLLRPILEHFYKDALACKIPSPRRWPFKSDVLFNFWPFLKNIYWSCFEPQMLWNSLGSFSRTSLKMLPLLQLLPSL